MRDPRVVVAPGTLAEGACLELEAGEARHVATVLRRAVGSELVALDGAGRSACVRVESVHRHRVTVQVGTVVRHPPQPGPALDLALAVLHTSAMDWAVQKATELGVRRLVPLVAARSQAGGRAAERRLEHWRRTAMQALKQCGRPWALEIDPPRTLDELVGEPPPGPVVAASDGVPVARSDVGIADTTLVVGPEGGFDDRETAALREAGWPRIVLSRHTLRAETAAVAGVAILADMLWANTAPTPVHGPTV